MPVDAGGCRRGGAPPDPEYACDRLVEVNGVFEMLDGTGMCMGLWDPVTITACGTWHGLRVSFAERSGNRGCAIAATDRVFAF